MSSSKETNNNSESVWLEVEKILKKRVKKSKVEYLIKWKSGGKAEWIPAEKCNCPKVVADFKKSIGEQDDEYEVEGIIDSIEFPDESIGYLVKWRGFDMSENSWVHENDMSCVEMIDDFKNGNAYTDKELHKIKKIKQSCIHNKVEHYKVAFEGEKTVDNDWYPIDMIWVMPNGRKALCKFLKKFI